MQDIHKSFKFNDDDFPFLSENVRKKKKFKSSSIR